MLPHDRVKAVARAGPKAFDSATIDRLCRRILNSAHPKQRAAIEDPAFFVTFLCTRGSGKTTAEVARMLIKMIRVPKARCVFIATTREAARTLIWDDLRDIIDRLGLSSEASFAEVRLTLTLRRNGSTLRIVGADDLKEIEKLRGKSYHEVGIDEAASHPAKLLEHLIDRVLSPRMGDTDGCIALFGTPGHRLEGPFYEATRIGSPIHRPWTDRDKPEYAGWVGWSSHSWNLLDGASYVHALQKLWDRALLNKQKEKWSDDHPVWRREYLGLWAADDTENIYKYKPHADDGSAWNQWDPPLIGALQIAKLPDGPKDWIYAVGADMGSSDPFALVVLAASPSDPTRTIYQIHEFSAPKMYAKRIAEYLLGAALDHDKLGGLFGAIGWPSGMVADMTHLGPAVLDELADVYGVRFAPAEQKEKFASIELFNGDLIDGRMKILKGSEAEEQMLSLQWQANEFGKVSEIKSQANHVADAAIYARRLLANLFANEAPPPKMPSFPRRVVVPVDEPESEAKDEFAEMLGDGNFDEMWGND